MLASRVMTKTNNPAVTAETLMSFSTDAVSPAQRMDYWYSDVLRRLDTVPGHNSAAPFHARMIRLAAADAELLDHTGGAHAARRSAARCRADQRDDISINFVATPSRTYATHGETKRVLRAGDMMVLDSSLPTEIKRGQHRAITLFIPRAQVDAVHREPARLAGRLILPTGMAGILRSHLQATVENAASLLPAQRVLAMQIATQMALRVLCDEASTVVESPILDDGLYHAAKAYIAQECTNSELTPSIVAMHLGCSRTTLYRAFSGHGETVSASIWASRIAHARQMLTSNLYRHLQIGEIAFRSGFSDHSTFDRVFKRTYGMKPRDARQVIWLPPD